MSEATPCKKRFTRLIEEGFIGGLSARKRQALGVHLKECDGCRSYYDRLAAVERTMEGAGSLPSTRAQQEVMDAVIRPAKKKTASRLWAPLGALAATAVALVLFITPAEEQEWRARGGERQAFQGRPPGLKIFCIKPPDNSGGAKVVGHVRAEASRTARLRCPQDHEIQVAYSTPTSPPLQARVLAIIQGRAEVVFVPGDENKITETLALDRVDEPFRWSHRMEQLPAGTSRLAGHFWKVGARTDEEPLMSLEIVLERKK